MSVFAFFGPAGTFTEMALDRLLDAPFHVTQRLRSAQPNVVKLAAASPAATIEAVRSGAADFGCVPIESSLEGSVPATMDALVPDTEADRVQVFAETVLDISFTIAARPGTNAAQIRTLAAYPVASAQVRNRVAELLPDAEFVTATSNAAAAEDVAAGRADAAVTTELAASSNGLAVLVGGVSDAPDATTRFLLVGRPGPPPEPTGTDRTAVILELSNSPGSLMAAMNEFASRGIDLTRIESRPQRDVGGATSTGKYRFSLDAVGHIDDHAVAEALGALHRSAERVVYLGSWSSARGGGTPPPDHRQSAEWLAAMRRGDN